MFGNPIWFKPRKKYLGWGLTPNTWQGWLYLVVMFAPLFMLAFLGLNTPLQIGIYAVWMLVVLFDIAHIMVCIVKEGHEQKPEVFTTRNILWILVPQVVSLILVYPIFTALCSPAVVKFMYVFFLFYFVVSAVVVKATAYWYLRKE
jgi:hypothetical protein